MLAAVASQAGEIEGDVGSLASPVSLSVSGSQPVAAYTVKLKNTGLSNTIHNGRLVATTTVVGGLTGAKATFKSVSGATCSTSAEGTGVDCSVGSLNVGESKVFTLTFFSPHSGTRIDLGWNAVFDSGTHGGSNGDSGTTSIELAAIDPTRVTSAVPPNETVSVFTGNHALPSGWDEFTVAITVPPVNVGTTASVVETDVSTNMNCTSLRNFVRCYQSSISIPGVVFADSSGSYLTFVLRVDKSNIRKGARIDKVLIQYEDNDVDPPVLVPTVQFCLRDGSGNPLPNLDKTPCIAKADDHTRKSPHGWFGFQYTIISLKNGSFGLF